MVPTAWIYSIQFRFWLPQLHQHLHPHSTYHLGSRTYPLPLGFNTGQEMTKNENIRQNTSRWTYIDWHMSEIQLLTDVFHLSTMASSLSLLEISSNMLQLQHTTVVHCDTTLHRMHSHNDQGEHCEIPRCFPEPLQHSYPCCVTHGKHIIVSATATLQMSLKKCSQWIDKQENP